MSETNPSPINQITDPKYRPMLVVVITLGILIAIATGALITGLILKTGKSDKDTPSVVAETVKAKPKKPASIKIAPGFRILGAEVQSDRLILHARSDAEDEYAIIDLADGRVLARIQAEAPK